MDPEIARQAVEEEQLLSRTFLAFAYDDYYPSGAEGDFVGAYRTFDEARLAGVSKDRDYVSVYDVKKSEWTTVKISKKIR